MKKSAMYLVLLVTYVLSGVEEFGVALPSHGAAYAQSVPSGKTVNAPPVYAPLFPSYVKFADAQKWFSVDITLEAETQMDAVKVQRHRQRITQEIAQRARKQGIDFFGLAKRQNYANLARTISAEISGASVVGALFTDFQEIDVPDVSDPKWVQIHKNFDSTFFVLADTARQRNGIGALWVLMDLPEPSKHGDKSYLSSQMLYQFNCKEGRARRVTSTQFGQHMAHGEIVNVIDALLPWQSVTPGSIFGSMMSLSCK